jgi:hypothetical protein
MRISRWRDSRASSSCRATVRSRHRGLDMHQTVVLVLCLFTLPSAQAQRNIPERAMTTLTQYSHALIAADCEGMQTTSAVIRRHPEAKDVVCAAAISWKNAGLYERLREPTSSLSHGRNRMVVVPNSRIMLSAGGPTITNGLYVVVSRDAGQTWQVVDIACDQLPTWVRGLYPAYNGWPKFGAATLDHPKNE